jgi:hypothetical protein
MDGMINKRNLIWFCLLCAVVVLPTGVQAQFTYTNANGSILDYYSIPGFGVRISGYTGPPWAVIIPTNLNGLTVIDIANGEDAVFSSSVTSVTILDSVVAIGDNAFAGCEGLTSVTIPDSVTNIGMSAFQGCLCLTNVTIPGSILDLEPYLFNFCIRLTNVTISDGTTSIEPYAFEGCYALASVTIPGSVSNIFPYAFANCTNLTNLTISEGVSTIYGAAFENCTSLTSVTLPGSASNIDLAPFPGCTNLTAINVDPKNSVFSSVNGVLFADSQSVLFEFPGGLGGNYTIPNSVTSIAPDAFEDCPNLTDVTVAGNINYLGGFDDCPNLTSFYFLGNAPPADSSSTEGITNATVYYLSGTAGWGDFATNTGITTVLWNPLIQTGGASFGVSNNQFGFNIAGTANIPIVVEACTNLANPVWTPLQTNTLTNSLIYFSDPQWTNYSCRFYGLGFP